MVVRKIGVLSAAKITGSVLRNAVSDIRANVNLWPAMIKAER